MEIIKLISASFLTLIIGLSSIGQNSATEWNNIGLSNYNSQNFEDAIDAFDQALLLDPKSVSGYNNKGNTYVKMGEFEQAITQFTLCIELNPNDVTAYFN